MQFCFYPRHEHGCQHISHCPHLGGAALGTLVDLANQNEESGQYLLRTIDAQREQISRLLAQTERLEHELQQAKLELKLERQKKFATRQQQVSENTEAAEPTSPAANSPQRKKRGAPVGHPGCYRRPPGALCGKRNDTVSTTAPID